MSLEYCRQAVRDTNSRYIVSPLFHLQHFQLFFSDNQIYRKRSAFFSARFCPSLLQVVSDNFNFYILFSKQIKLFWTVMMLCLFSSFYITFIFEFQFLPRQTFQFSMQSNFAVTKHDWGWRYEHV